MGVDAPRSGAWLPRDIWVLVGASFVIAIGYGIVAPALPTFARTFDVGVTAASLVVSAFAVLRTVFAPVSGRLVARLGELRVFCAGLVIVGVSSGACAVATTYWQLLLFRSIGGIGSTMFTVSAASLLIRIAPPSIRGRASGAWSTGFLLGNILGPAVGGMLIELSPRAPFLIYAVLLLVAAAISGGLLWGRAGEPAPQAEATAGPGVFGVLLRHPSFRAALTSNFVNGWTVYGVRIALVPLLVVEVLGYESLWSGVALAAFAAGTAVTLLPGGLLADRRGRRPPILVGTATVALTAMWLGLSGSVAGLVTASLLSGVGTGLVNPPVTASVGDVITAQGSPTTAGPALAGFQMVGDVGAIVGPVLCGAAAELVGYPSAFALTAVIASVSFGFWLRAPETLPR
ncbi:MFS transporter [Pseudonocardia acaciae]|uniref:MFS transporter n=1 Tax=Pseudonocardia acaciae TaxID=551276 RepID=UPI0005692102|nr:MFS transporter [Pseudonocardia acaciae]